MGTAATRHDPALKAYRQAAGLGGSGPVDDQVMRHLPLVRSVVDRIAANLPASVDREDLLHAGVIGLIDALKRFDSSRDHAFSTYAVLRIRGQVIDELRARDWVPRGARSRARDYQQAVKDLSSRLGRLPDDGELAERLGVTTDELPGIEHAARLAVQVSIDGHGDSDGGGGPGLAGLAASGGEDPSDRLDQDDRRRVLTQALGRLSEQERLVIKLYYFENLLMKEIAEILDLTESRICQIHARVLTLLRTRLGVDAC